jgi:hypothetical protein
LFWSTVVAYTARGFYEKKKHNIRELQHLLEREKGLRGEERRSRIKLQQAQRGQAQQKDNEEGYCMRPIGVVQSQYPDRRGTPRQPNLVRSSRGRVVFDKKQIQHEHFKELGEAAHL